MAQILSGFSEKEWQANLQWLDSSGLALYLLDRLTRFHVQTILPDSVLRRLQQNLVDNTDRNAGLFAEAVQINLGLQSEGVLFANFKGFTLSPESVLDPALRCQLDLDFLVVASHATAAAGQLEQLGYKLDCISGNTWEFKAGNSQVASLKQLYKTKPQRVAELHLLPAEGVLERVQMRFYSGFRLPVLHPADLFLTQALHLFKHVCSAFIRAAWLLEYRQHVIARSNDAAFWLQLEQLAGAEPEVIRALSVVTGLISEVFGDVPPAALSRLVSGQISPSVQLWISIYGRSIVLADFPGTKLYRLLQAELDRMNPAPLPAPGRRRPFLVGPPMITQKNTGESLAIKLNRYCIQLHYIAFRLRFHCVEGARYTFESFRFRRLVIGLLP